MFTKQLTNTSSGSFDELHVRSPANGPFQNILALIGSGSGGGSGSGYDDTQVRADIATNAAAISNNTVALANKATTTALNTGLAGKQNTIGDGDLTIAKTNGLQTSLDSKATTAALNTGLAGKQNTIADGDLSIARTSGLQTALDSKATTTALNTGLAGKQNTIGDGDLTIARTSGLQSALDSKATTTDLNTGLAGKQNTIGDGDLSIAKTSGLQTALDSKATTTALNTGLAGKQNVIGDGDLSIARTSGLQTALDGKATTAALNTGLAGKQNLLGLGDLSIGIVSGLQTDLDAKQATLGWRGSTLGTYLPGTNISFSNSTVQIGSTSNELVIVSSPSIAQIEGGALTSELASKAPQSTTYSKTEVQGFLATKMDSGDQLQINTSGTNYQQITHMAFPNASVSTNNTSAIVTTASPPQLKVSGAYVDFQKLEFADSTLTLGSSSGEYAITSTPQMASVQGLTAALAGKADTSDLYPEIWTAAGNTYQRLNKLWFSNFQYPLNVGLNSNAEGYGAWELKATPALEDISDITVTSTTVEFGKTLTVTVQNNPGPGTEDTLMWFKTGSYSHRMTGKFDTGANSGNFLRWYVRNASGGLQAALQIRGDSAIVGWGTLYIPTISCSGTCTAQSYITASDERIKADIQEVDLCPIFDNCRVRSYDRKDRADLGKRVGFIANEIQKACADNNIPNTFNNDIEREDGSILLGLDYSRMVCVAFSKIRQLEARLAVLEQK